ncbi:MAG: hypothetical protein HYU64_09245 [Armatimonadetes bacterium]|nr:hypothetical protein [Armatimonadota bacterium]
MASAISPFSTRFFPQDIQGRVSDVPQPAADTEIAQLIDLMASPEVVSRARDFLRQAKEAEAQCRQGGDQGCPSVSKGALTYWEMVKGQGGTDATANLMLLGLGVAAGSYANAVSPLLMLMLAPMVADDPQSFKKDVEGTNADLGQLPSDQQQMVTSLGTKAQELLPGYESEEALFAEGLGIGMLQPASP